MQSVSNKELRKYFLLAVLIGLTVGIIYTHFTSRYTSGLQISLELLQKLEILKNRPQSKMDAKVTEEDFLKMEGEMTASLSKNMVVSKLLIYENDETKEQFKKPGGNNLGNRWEDGLNQTGSQLSDNTVNRTTLVHSAANNKCLINNNTLGPLYVDKADADLEILKRRELNFVKPGGHWSPDGCVARKKVAIVIPYRNRKRHLGIFLRHMHPMLKRQNLEYRIFVIDQADEFKFNRGKLMNIGYKEALSYAPFECFVFHDIDLIPEDDRNDYGCPASPMHLSVAVDIFSYKLLYEELFGGVEMFSKKHFEKLNGFSNSFWGWGAEDDNLYFRMKLRGLKLWRPAMKIGRYTMLGHNSNQKHADGRRFDILRESKKEEYVAADGLSSLQYQVIEREELPLFTLVRVNLVKHQDKMFGLNEYL